MAAPLEFYFDFGSPYAYLAGARIDDLAARHGRTVEWRPFLLGAVFKVTGMKPNMHQPLRGAYLKQDTRRCARRWGIPFTFPEVMPMNALVPSRAYYWLLGIDAGRAKALARAVFHAHWAEGRDLGSLEQIVQAADEAGLGLDPAALAAGVQDPAVKERLRAETDQAMARGVFGAPFFFVDGEPFWGADRLEHIDRWLRIGGW